MKHRLFIESRNPAALLARYVSAPGLHLDLHRNKNKLKKWSSTRIKYRCRLMEMKQVESWLENLLLQKFQHTLTLTHKLNTTFYSQSSTISHKTITCPFSCTSKLLEQIINLWIQAVEYS